MHPRIRSVVDAAAAADLRIEVERYPDGTRSAADAARAVGCQVGQIVKSLVFVADGTPVVALASGANRVDTRRLASVLAASEVRRADGDEVRDATGFAIGGVAPVGYPAPVETLIDRDLLQYDVVWAAAGTPHHVFPIKPDDLVRVTGGRVLDLRVDLEREAGERTATEAPDRGTLTQASAARLIQSARVPVLARGRTWAMADRRLLHEAEAMHL